MSAHPSPPRSTDPVAFWESRYGESDAIWSGRPNAALVREAGDLEPGHALDLGSGEGGDSLWLAQRGWTVTAVDISATALARGARAAEAAGLAARITWVRADLGSWQPTERFDLVSAQFLQSPVELPRETIFRRAATWVASGGRLLIVDHGAPPPGSAHAHDVVFPTPEGVLADLALDPDDWAIVACELRSREANGPHHFGTLVDSVVSARRT